MLADLPGKDRGQQSFSQGFRWLLTMQNPDGGWSAFERNINHNILNEIPFADFGREGEESRSPNPRRGVPIRVGRCTTGSEGS